MDQLGAGASKRKRQAGDTAAAVEAGPRAKRRKETSGMSITIPAQKSRTSGTPAQEAVSEEHEDEDGEHDGADEDVQGAGEGAERVRELGLQIWQAVRGARSNDDRDIAIDFLKLPPKKQYPDYYRIIKKPIALEEIKAKIENGSYPTLKAVKKAFDQCFRNAKRYNMNESPIWVAAKVMQKIASKEYKKLAASPDTEEEDVDIGDADGDAPHGTSTAAVIESDDGDDDADDGDDGDERVTTNGATTARKSSRKQSPSRLLKNKLQKLIKKAPKDAEGNLFSNPFLVLPNKKEWPDYYRLIEKPIAFDAIFKKLKRKMYPTTADFVADVELVFSNALLFNEDRSPVWIAAQTLRPMFHKLLAELPPEYTPSATPTQPPGQGPGQGQGGPKIKLRMQPKADAATMLSTITTTAPSQAVASHAGDQTLQQIPTNTTTTSTPAPSTSRQRHTNSKTTGSVPSPAAAAAPLPVPAKPSQTQPQTPQYQYPPSTASAAQHRAPAPVVYHPQPQFPPPTTTLASPHGAIAAARSYSQYPPTPPVAPRSPTPETTPSTTIRSITLVTAPAGRTIVFHSTSDGGGVSLRYWAVRLGRNETSVKLRMDVEKGPDEEDGKEDESTTAETESSAVVDAEGKKFSAAVKLNGTHLPPAPQPATRNASTPAPDIAMADGTGPKTNGHHDGGAASGSESEDESGKGKGPAARSTRSGKVPAPSMKNGKAKRKRRGKKVGGTTMGIDLGPWDASLVVGSNVLDVRAGGKDGERWRVFVDRVL